MSRRLLCYYRYDNLYVVASTHCQQNMVAPGDVDAGLTQETAEECKKFGAVVNCHVHVVRLTALL